MTNEFLDRIRGPVFPVITPFDKNGAVDYNELHRYLEFLYDGGASVFYVMAHSSRLGLLETQEVMKLNKEVCDHFNGYGSMTTVICATPIYGGIGAYTEVVQDAFDYGADLVSVLFTERYYNDKQIVEFYEEMAECGPLLVHEEWLNSIKGSNREMWSIDLLEKVLNLDNIVAIKEDSHDFDFTKEVRNRFGNDISVIVSGGGKGQFFEHLPQAYLVGVGSFWPDLSVKFYKLIQEKKYKKAMQIIENIEDPFFELAMEIGWHLALKSAMEHLGIMNRYERRPLRELGLEEHIKVGNILSGVAKYRDEFYDFIRS